jgi:hypothetical protein
VPLSPPRERRLLQVDPITAAPHLRLVWPQWQGAGTESVRSLAPEFPFDIARRGYSVGTKVLQAVLPEHDGPTAIVPVESIDADEIQLGLGTDRGGLTTAEARRVVADIDGAAEVVALTIAEFIPRQVMHLQQILAGFPLLGPKA